MRRALVVEDNAALGANVAELLEELHVTAKVARTAKEALEAVDDGLDLAVVDLQLAADVSGLDLVPKLRERAPEAEFVVMTGHASLDTALAAVRTGVFAYLLKPFAPDDLLAICGRALEQVSLRRERTRLARELARSEALYRTVVEATGALILGLDDRGGVRFMNRAASDRIGRGPGHGASGPWLIEDACGEAERPKIREAVVRALGGEQVRSITFRLPDEGERAVGRFVFSPVGGGAGGPLRVLAVGLDVTEQVDLERRSREQESMAAMGRLTAALAHEVRNPLNAAKLQLELLRRGVRKIEDDAREPIEERAAIVEKELRRLADLLDDFLTMARSPIVERTSFDLGAIVDDVLDLQRPHAESLGATLDADLEADVRIDGDRKRVHQLLVNLVVNALEALDGRSAARVLVTARRAGDWVEVDVEDNGPGFADDLRERATQPFVTGKVTGTGLGLSIVHNIVNAHGGELELGRSVLGGARVRVRLPRG